MLQRRRLLRFLLALCLLALSLPIATLTPFTLPSIAHASPNCTLPTPGRPAKFEPADGRIYSGVGQSTPSEILSLVNKGGSALKPSLVAFYDALGDSSNTTAGYHLRYTLMTAHNLFPGAMLQVGLKLPQNPTNQPNPANAQKLIDIGAGLYDGTITQMARAYKALGQPIFVRIGYEFDGYWNGYDPTAYKNAFRRIVCIFRADVQADNVAFVWNSYTADNNAEVRQVNGQPVTYNKFNWYPGDDVVDWFSFNANICAGCLSATSPGPLGINWFKGQANTHNKPIMIGESTYNGAYHPSGYVYTWSDWFSGNTNVSPAIGAFFPALRASGVKGYQFINENWPVTGAGLCGVACSTWQNSEIASPNYPGYPTALNQYNQELAGNASVYLFRDTSYANPVPIWVTASRNLPSSANGQPWQQASDEYALQTGYSYSVSNAVQYYGDGSNSGVTWGSVPNVYEIDVDLGVPSTVPAGYIHLNAYTAAGQGVDVYIGSRKVASQLSLDGISHVEYAYTAADRNASGAIRLRFVSPDQQQVRVRRIGLQTATSALAAPTNLVAIRDSATVIRLSWNSVTNASLYNIYRDGQLVGTSSNVWFADTSATAGQTYTYTVSAWDSHAGEGALSSATTSRFGKSDIFSWDTTGIWTVRLSTGSSFNGGWTFGPWGNTNTTFLTGDFNGDGKDDIFSWDTTGIWTVRLSTGSSFNGSWTFGPWGNTNTTFLTGDFNGDGKDDIFSWDTTGIWTVRLSTGSSFNGGWTFGPWGNTNTTFLTGDFNGDGKDDIFSWDITGIWTVRLSTGSSFNGGWTFGPWGNTNTTFLTGDFNGDGKDDIFSWDTTGIWTVRLSTGSSFNGGWTFRPWGNTNTTFLTGDFNGDGKDDIFSWDTTGIWTVRLSTGSSFNGGWTFGPWGNTNTTFLTGDFNGN